MVILCILIYDIDGTLTYAHGDIPDVLHLSTYAYWPLISCHFSTDEQALKESIALWEESMKYEIDPTGSSHNMMQRTILTFAESVSERVIRSYAKEITLQFFHCGILRGEAISHLKCNIENGNKCVLSTGSYQDGALGFIDGLVEAGLLSFCNAQKINVSGALIDWETKTLLHANVRERKIIGLEKVLGINADELKQEVVAVFADDPLINDRDILGLAPEGAGYVIQTNKNASMSIPESYKHVSWEEILRERAIVSLSL